MTPPNPFLDPSSGLYWADPTLSAGSIYKDTVEESDILEGNLTVDEYDMLASLLDSDSDDDEFVPDATPDPPRTISDFKTEDPTTPEQENEEILKDPRLRRVRKKPAIKHEGLAAVSKQKVRVPSHVYVGY